MKFKSGERTISQVKKNQEALMKALRQSRQGKLKAFRPPTGGDKMDRLVLEMVNRTCQAYLPINRMQLKTFGLKVKQ